MRPLRAADGRLVAVRDDDEKIHIAVFVRIAPRVRAEQPDLFRLEFSHESLGRRPKQMIVERFHKFYLAHGRVG